MPLRTLGFRELGLNAYEPTWHAMQRFTDQRKAAAENDDFRVKEVDDVGQAKGEIFHGFVHNAPGGHIALF